MITPSFSLTATERVLPRLALDFTTASLDSRVTFTRSGNTATVVNSLGLIQAVNADIPRFDFDPITKICKGLLIEESRTNLFPTSEDINSWTQTNGAVNPTPAASPDGTTNAYKFVEDTSTALHFLRLNVTFSNQAYTSTVFVKAAGRTRFEFGGFAIGCGRGFDLSNGTTFTNTLGLSEPTSFSITNMGNGWYRCSITGTSPGGSSSFRYYLNNGTSASYTGNGTDGMYFWGGQVEAGAFATSYIPTVATSVTRNADVATMTGTNFSDWYNASEGAFVSEIQQSSTINNGSTFRSIYVLLPASGSVSSTFTFVNFANQFQTIYTDSSATQASFAVGLNTGTISKVATTYKVNSFAAAAQGNATSTDVSGTVPASITQATLGNVASLSAAGCLNGYIRKLFYYPQRLTNAEVQAFSK